MFEANSDDTIEYEELTMDLNPIRPNIWGSLETISLPYESISFSGRYQSFTQTEADFEVTFTPELQIGFEPARPFSFDVNVREVDFASFPTSLIANIQHVHHGTVDRVEGPVLEPRLRIGGLSIVVSNNGFASVSLSQTPSGDANNDGSVGFDDFLILSGNFAMASARWEDGDFDGDGEVRFPDFLALSKNFGPTELVSVPEPESLPFAGLGFLALLAEFRKRRGRKR